MKISSQDFTNQTALNNAIQQIDSLPATGEIGIDRSSCGIAADRRRTATTHHNPPLGHGKCVDKSATAARESGRFFTTIPPLRALRRPIV